MYCWIAMHEPLVYNWLSKEHVRQSDEYKLRGSELFLRDPRRRSKKRYAKCTPAVSQRQRWLRFHEFQTSRPCWADVAMANSGLSMSTDGKIIFSMKCDCEAVLLGCNFCTCCVVGVTFAWLYWKVAVGHMALLFLPVAKVSWRRWKGGGFDCTNLRVFLQQVELIPNESLMGNAEFLDS